MNAIVYTRYGPPDVPQLKKLAEPTPEDNEILIITNEKTEDLIYLRKLIEDGKIKTVIDRDYPSERISEAHRYVES